MYWQNQNLHPSLDTILFCVQTKRYPLHIGNLSYYNANSGYDLTKPYSEKTAELIDLEVRRIVDEVTEKTRKLLKDNWEGLEKLAEQLIEKEVIMAEDIEAIFGPKAGRHGEDRLKDEPVEETVNQDEQSS